MGDETSCGLGAGGLSAQGGPTSHGKATVPAPGWKLGVTPLVGSDTGGGAGGSGGVRPEELEHSCAVYCGADDSGPL